MQPVAKLARASLASFVRALRCRNSAYFSQYSSVLRLDPVRNLRRDTAREFHHGLLCSGGIVGVIDLDRSFNLRSLGENEFYAQTTPDADGGAQLRLACLIDRDDQFIAKDTDGDGSPAPGFITGDELDGLRIDPDGVEIDLARCAIRAIELAAPRLPDVLRLAESHRQGDIAKPAMRAALFVEDLLDIVMSERNDPAKNLADSIRMHDMSPPASPV
jgi:hypothetical protein